MPRFRAFVSASIPGAVTDLFAVGQLIDDAMRPGNFFVAPDLRFTWIAARSETIPWEIFRGRLALPTRQQKTFLSWHAEQDGNAVISVKLDVHQRRIHVTRGILAYVWEAYDSSAGIESREVESSISELVGTIELADYTDLESVQDELICLVWQAVVGASRLPLTSVEAPLPAFSFGKLHYCYRPESETLPMRAIQELVPMFDLPKVSRSEHVKLLEFALRAADTHVWSLIQFLAKYYSSRGFAGHIWREMFNGVSLSPYTRFVENVQVCFGITAPVEEFIGFYTHLLNQLHRHLTAFDLVTFHHRGANYPDALVLDAVLNPFVGMTSWPDFSRGDESSCRRRRRALRQACLVRRYYEGHLVPDAPTSPGENARVLPASHPRVPEEQLSQTTRRRKQLYADAPLGQLMTDQARAVLALAIEDLVNVDERVEMGLGVFIDRPLGYAKEIGEPDLTPLLAHEAFSPSLARRRWNELKAFAQELAIPFEPRELDQLFEQGPWPNGLPCRELAECPRPAAALADVRKVADDFVILRTLPGGLRQLLRLFDWRPLLESYRLDFLNHQQVRLFVPALDERQRPIIAAYDADLKRRLELQVDPKNGFRTRAGIEWPKAGLRVSTVVDDDGIRHEELDVIVNCAPP